MRESMWFDSLNWFQNRVSFVCYLIVAIRTQRVGVSFIEMRKYNWSNNKVVLDELKMRFYP